MKEFLPDLSAGLPLEDAAQFVGLGAVPAPA